MQCQISFHTLCVQAPSPIANELDEVNRACLLQCNVIIQTECTCNLHSCQTLADGSKYTMEDTA
eukprot:3596597-Amphidinium_carterae.1